MSPCCVVVSLPQLRLKQQYGSGFAVTVGTTTARARATVTAAFAKLDAIADEKNSFVDSEMAAESRKQPTFSSSAIAAVSIVLS